MAGFQHCRFRDHDRRCLVFVDFNEREKTAVMKPILFYIGPLPVYSFGAMIALGVFLSLFLMNRKSKRTGFPAAPELTADLVFTGVLSGFLGGR